MYESINHISWCCCSTVCGIVQVYTSTPDYLLSCASWVGNTVKWETLKKVMYTRHIPKYKNFFHNSSTKTWGHIITYNHAQLVFQKLKECEGGSSCMLDWSFHMQCCLVSE